MNTCLELDYLHIVWADLVACPIEKFSVCIRVQKLVTEKHYICGLWYKITSARTAGVEQGIEQD